MVKPVIDYPNYEISDSGVVRNKKTGRILKTSEHTKGYLKVDLCKDGIRKTKLIHILVAIHFVEKPHGKDTVNHINKDKQNNHYTNLEWVTNLENIYHKYNYQYSEGEAF